jgi:anthranilate phosphoribosyltransferase
MKLYLQKLYEGQILTSKEANELLHLLCSTNQNNIQTASILSAYNMRRLDIEELIGFQQAMMELCLTFDTQGIDVIDVCGTGGDGKDTFNISTLSAFVLAGANIPVAKHGNYAVSSACGSSNVLEYLGLKFTNNTSILLKQLEKANICILHAPLFHPAMKNVAEVRKLMQVKTIFNILGPLCNPATPSYQCSGTYNEEVATLYHTFLQKKCKSYAVIFDTAVYDEISLTADILLYQNGKKNILSKNTFTHQNILAENIKGGKDVASSAQIFMDILSGKGTIEQNEVVIANSAVAIQTYYPKKSLLECMEIAKESILSESALRSFNNLLSI